MGKIILVSGGVSSGKSDFAEELTSNLQNIRGADKCLYIATSQVYDAEMEEKVKKHQISRKKRGWDSLEIYKNIDSVILAQDFGYGVVILDCITMMITSLIFDGDINFDAIDQECCRVKSEMVVSEVDNLIMSARDRDIDLVLVTNEVGLGGVSPNRLTRFYSQLVGRVNQTIAKKADDVYLVISSIGVKIK